MLLALSSDIPSGRITSGPSGVPSRPSSGTFPATVQFFRHFRHLAEVSSLLPSSFYLIINPDCYVRYVIVYKSEDSDFNGICKAFDLAIELLAQNKQGAVEEIVNAIG